MKTTLAMLALILSGVTTYADIKPGQWSSISLQRNKIIAGANFSVSSAGKIKGKALYYNGAVTRVSGEVNEDGSFEITETAPGFKSEASGKVNRRGDSFTAKAGSISIFGRFIRSSFKAAGVYRGFDTAGDAVGGVISPEKRITLFVFDGRKLIRMDGKLRPNETFSLSGDGGIAEGELKRGKLRGAYRINAGAFAFVTERL